MHPLVIESIAKGEIKSQWDTSVATLPSLCLTVGMNHGECVDLYRDLQNLSDTGHQMHWVFFSTASDILNRSPDLSPEWMMFLLKWSDRIEY